MWRRQRFAMAEAAVYRAALQDTLTTAWKERRVVPRSLAHLAIEQPTGRAVDAIRATPESTQQDAAELAEDRDMTETALRLLRTGIPGAFDRAVAALHESTRCWWADNLANEQHENADGGGGQLYRTDAASLQRFLETEVAQWYATRETELANQPLILAQALGEIFDPERLE